MKEKRLTEILNSEYFSALRRRQFVNPLSPCMLIHRPGYLRDDLETFRLRDTDAEPAPVANERIKTDLDRWSKEYGRLADREHRRFSEEVEFRYRPQ